MLALVTCRAALGLDTDIPFIHRELPDTGSARIDLVPTARGPVLFELELTEPSMFLQDDPETPARAAAVFRSLVP